MPWHLKERFASYSQAWEPIIYGIWAVYAGAKKSFREGRYRDMFSMPSLQDSGFYLWFTTLNEHMVNFESNLTVLPTLVPTVSGVVLELGPGVGNQLCRFDKTKVTRVVGVEPNAHFAPDVARNVAEHGLEGVYELLTCGIEDSDVLERHGIVAGSVDTILSVQVLCSVADPQSVVRELYRLLKPGGRLVFWEHHRSSDRATVVAQYFWNPLWRRLIGGCNLTRDMKAIIGAAGPWENLDSLEGDEKEKPWGLMPRVWGELVKPERT
ncbi:methyltransferase type 11 [Lasiosphaeris hirsuta]|uniref:Methyltransferase type 11 n=1 Tax=Lasiosphaeris hirsuta TaxID=260670 RepID=A0AA39ZVF7_9PEZI|nr:methyltransferase type 11 [Lasiosphaeris hirsuta]